MKASLALLLFLVVEGFSTDPKVFNEVHHQVEETLTGGYSSIPPEVFETNCAILGENTPVLIEGIEVTGACLDYAECAEKGEKVGQCASGMKACCLVTTDGGSTDVPVSYFNNADPPMDVTLVISPANQFFSQIRLDFGPTLLAEPNSEGNCVFESLTISGHSGKDITICGINTAQHSLYSSFFRYNAKALEKSKPASWLNPQSLHKGVLTGLLFLGVLQREGLKQPKVFKSERLSLLEPSFRRIPKKSSPES